MAPTNPTRGPYSIIYITIFHVDSLILSFKICDYDFPCLSVTIIFNEISSGLIGFPESFLFDLSKFIQSGSSLSFSKITFNSNSSSSLSTKLLTGTKNSKYSSTTKFLNILSNFS